VAQTVVNVDPGDPWWVDLAQILSGFGALAAALLAYFGIRQARALQAERQRERTRERLEDRIYVLNDGIEILLRLRAEAKAVDTVAVARDQRRLLVAAHRAAAESSHEFQLAANYTFEGAEGQKEELQSMCDAAMEKAVWEIGVLASEINAAF
jgi:hypothetical protein